MKASVVTLWALWSCAALSCKPGVGGACDRGEARCLDGQRALVCQAGKLIATACKGKDGCRITARGVACDFSGNAAGDACSTDDEGGAACSDDRTMLSCRGGAYVSVPCKGPRGCVMDSRNALCDASLASASDDCKPGARACGTDGVELLACANGKMKLVHHCRGKEGCSSKAGKLGCDMSVAKIDDPCTNEMQGNVACSADGTEVLVCRGQRFAIDEVCKAGKSCDGTEGSIECARH